MRNTGSFLCIGFIAALLVPFASASAQYPVALKPGDRVRVDLALVEAQAVEGTFQGVRGDSVLILLRAGSEVAQIPKGDMARISVHLGKRGNGWRGFRIGLVPGAVLWGALVLAQGDQINSHRGTSSSAEENAVKGAVFGGLVVGVLGAFVGELVQTERWEEVAVPSIRPSHQLAPNGRLGFGLTIPVGR